MSTIDLHVHSIFSDGSDTLEKIFEKSTEIGIKTISITDHDTLAGLCLAKKLALQHNINFITGTELTGIYEEDELHILCYNFTIDNPIIKDLIHSIKIARNTRNEKLIENFSNIGINMTLEKLNKGNKETVITRGNVASYLVENGYALNRDEAFKKYLNPDTKTFVKKGGISAKDCIQIIKKGGALSILAHPNLYKIFENFEYHLNELIGYDLDGIECFHSTYSKETQDFLINMAKKYNLLITGGSDYHGTGKKDVKLGVGKDNLNITEQDISIFLKQIHN